MRIGLITACYWPVVNGVTRMVEMYCEHLAMADHEVTVFTLGNGMSSGSTTDVVATPALPLGKSGYHLSLHYSKEARKLLSRMDIVHCHHLFMGLEFARRYSRSPIVFTNHTRYDLYAEAYSLLPQPAVNFLMRRLWPMMTDGCDVVIAPAASMRQTLRGFGVRQRIEVIENGIDLKIFGHPPAPRQKMDYGFPENTVLLAYVGRLSIEKNVPELLAQFASASRSMPELRLLVVGDGPLRGRLEARARELELSGKVHFSGQVAGHEVANHLAAASLFVTASKSEVHPLNVIEALAAGLPVIAYHSPGISDTIESGIDGLLVRKDDELAQAMTLLAGDSDTRFNMATAARRSASQYDIKTTVRKTVALYEELLQQELKQRPNRRRRQLPLDKARFAMIRKQHQGHGFGSRERQ